MNDRPKLAVIGSGISGITAAYILQNRFDVSLFEKNSRMGGHTNTINISAGPDAGTAVDTGFIVFNDRTYPLFNKLLRLWNVQSQNSDMSFSYWDSSTGFVYAGSDLNGLFADRSNIFSLPFLKLLFNIQKFNRNALQKLENEPEALEQLTLKAYLDELGLSETFRTHYLLPMASAIWSASQNRILEFPASTFLRFFCNHGLLHLTNRPQWKVIQGGSSSYLSAFKKRFNGRIFLSQAAEAIERQEDKIRLQISGVESRDFDYVVMACHADEALQLLSAPSKQETEILGAWKYSKNQTILHTDLSFMPRNRRAWASWNYIQDSPKSAEQPVTLTYDMNRLQSLTTVNRYLVTLNPSRKIPDDQIVTEIFYSHPQYNKESINAQKRLPEIQGFKRTFYCGAHTGYGFHEDGVRSAVEVTKLLGVPFE